MKDIRNEQRNQKFREEVFKALGRECSICGSTDGITIHHKIAVKLGGTNDIRNLDVLCRQCHYKVHGTQGIIGNNLGTGGRPERVMSKEEKIVFYQYLKGNIGHKQASSMLGVNKIDSSKGIFKRALDDMGVIEYENKIDMINAQMRRVGKSSISYVSRVWYRNGKVKTYCADGKIITSKAE